MSGVAGAIGGAVSPGRMLVECSPGSVSGVVVEDTGATDFCTAVTHEAFGAVTYTWAHVSGDTFTPQTSDTSNPVYFTGYPGSGVYQVTAVDSLGRSSVATVSVSIG